MNLTDKLALCWRILSQPRGGYLEHAEREMPPTDDEFGAALRSDVRELLTVLATQGHSEQSVHYVVGVFQKLALFEPLGPLTGEEHEWNEVGPGVFQNKRCSSVFKQADRFDGQAYDIRGVVFREPSGACYTNSQSRVPIVFPYIPKTQYVDVPE